jgi:pilus assembly protein CpaE
VSALYTADMIGLVANPDVPCVRNAQRLLDRIGQLGPCADRVKILLNRAAEPYPIPPSQLQTALGQPIFHTFPSDYKAVSSALNSGVPLALSGSTEMAAQFDKFIRRIISPGAETPEPVAAARRGALGIQRLASIW